MTYKQKKLDVLKGSFESGAIDKEEHDRLKKKLEHDAKESGIQAEELNKNGEPEIQSKSSEKILIISIGVIILLFASVFAYIIINKGEPKTLEEMHALNLNGKLKPSQGYLYKGVYSFITLDKVWYTQLTSPKGTKLYDLALRYSPRDLNDIVIEGNLNANFFNNQSSFYNTFNPTGKELSYVSLAVADFSTHMAKVLGKNPIAACDRNETEACKTRPIVTCEDAGKLVLYIKESERFRVYYNNNCIIVEGNGLDLVKGVDRILYNLYNIMEQAEV